MFSLVKVRCTVGHVGGAKLNVYACFLRTGASYWDPAADSHKPD